MRYKEFSEDTSIPWNQQDPFWNNSTLFALAKFYLGESFLNWAWANSPYNPESKYQQYKAKYTKIVNSVIPLANQQADIDVIIAAIDKQIPIFGVPKWIKDRVAQVKKDQQASAAAFAATSPQQQTQIQDPNEYEFVGINELIQPEIQRGEGFTKKLTDEMGLLWTAHSRGEFDLTIDIESPHMGQIAYITLEVNPDEQTMSSQDTWVHQRFRRMGLATKMYNWAEKLGNTVVASSTLSKMGKKFWKQRTSKTN